MFSRINKDKTRCTSCNGNVKSIRTAAASTFDCSRTGSTPFSQRIGGFKRVKLTGTMSDVSQVAFKLRPSMEQYDMYVFYYERTSPEAAAVPW